MSLIKIIILFDNSYLIFINLKIITSLYSTSLKLFKYLKKKQMADGAISLFTPCNTDEMSFMKTALENC